MARKAPLKSSTRDQIAALQSIASFMLKELKEVTARAEVVRLVLERKGIISYAEYESLRAEVLKEFDRAMNDRIQASFKATIDTLQRLVDAPPGKPQ